MITIQVPARATEARGPGNGLRTSWKSSSQRLWLGTGLKTTGPTTSTRIGSRLASTDADINNREYMKTCMHASYCLAKQSTSPVQVWIWGEGVIQGSNYFVHSLHVSRARVELRVDEEDTLHHLPVRLLALDQGLVLVGRLLPGAD